LPAKRIIACLDVKGGRVVKGVRFANHEDMGDPATLAARYRDQGADEIVIYDIAASPERRTIDYAWLSEIARDLDIPLCVAGGIRSIAQAVTCLEHGADKISVNSPALERPDFIDELVAVVGSQCVVLGVDSKAEQGVWRVHQYTGDVTTTRRTPRAMLDWIDEAQARGAGEVVLNCMDRDGAGEGYDIEQLKAAREILHVPLVASGGAGRAGDFADVFREADVSAALAAGALHRNGLTIGEVKQSLAAQGIEVRP
jgi:imidazole glycerol-phosphate synthase subunit HisF